MVMPLVVVLPGIGGSELADDDGRTVYSINARTVLARIADPAALDASRPLRATGLIGSYGLAWKQLITGYDGLIRELTSALQLRPEAVATAGQEQPNPRVSLLAFPYDFRQSVSACAQALDRELRKWLYERPVVMVGHSMGGLVAACWWANLSDGVEVKEIITLGTPFRGASKALDLLVNGARVGGVGLPDISAVLRGWDSVFDLLPHARVIEGGGAGNKVGSYPFQLPSELTEAVPRFAARARSAYEANRGLHKALAARAQRQGGHPFTVYYSQGHTTQSRALLDGGRLAVTKADPAWVPQGWDAGDGTVPRFSAIPRLAEQEPRTWRRLTRRHGELVDEAGVVAHVREYGLVPLPAAARGGGDAEAAPYLRLDLDEVVVAGQAWPVRVRAVGPDGEPLPAGEVAGRVAGVGFRAVDDGECWAAELPPLPEGLHELRITATGVPGADRITARMRIGAVP
ncbi:Lecithin:cholesterol acyltransferase [Actinomyces ruminicola]|uniref:Lecithin:cholesterol acyltransferase n=1 Tax=Actinomyces ruminicola TaxID=332524 RepID=A0A1H0DFT9_9ACTO|nr:lecithin--cholesterol acyltransferase [Actinomyces ruminicola]SDN69045.1 Lecithin:cholesterol acyltransferase [Actinomyces ruminicola]